MKYKSLIVDADDTLWYDSIYFRQLSKALISTIAVKDYEYRQVQKIVRPMLENAGPGESGFCDAVIEAAKYFGIDDGQHEILLDAIRDFKNHPIQFLPSAINVLKAEGSEKFLLTKGLAKEQMEKIQRSGVSNLFSRSWCLEEKSSLQLKKIIRELNLNAEEIVYIGNSVKDDIIPAVENGCNAIFLDHELNSIGRNSPCPLAAKRVRTWDDISILLQEKSW